jgi:hypothetical protein
MQTQQVSATRGRKEAEYMYELTPAERVCFTCTLANCVPNSRLCAYAVAKKLERKTA